MLLRKPTACVTRQFYDEVCFRTTGSAGVSARIGTQTEACFLKHPGGGDCPRSQLISPQLLAVAVEVPLHFPQTVTTKFLTHGGGQD